MIVLSVYIVHSGSVVGYCYFVWLVFKDEKIINIGIIIQVSVIEIKTSIKTSDFCKTHFNSGFYFNFYK